MPLEPVDERVWHAHLRRALNDVRTPALGELGAGSSAKGVGRGPASTQGRAGRGAQAQGSRRAVNAITYPIRIYM